MPQVSIVIPAFNERPIIQQNVLRVAGWMQENQPGETFEIVVVDDGSTDGMYEDLAEAMKTYPWLRVVRHPGNLGRGRALRTGFASSASRYVICMDSDLSYGPEHIPALLNPLKFDYADVTLASPYHPGGSVSHVPFLRARVSRWGNRILSRGLDRRFYTVTCMVRGFRREILDDLELVNDGKELHLEILHKALMLGYRVIEVPAHLSWPEGRRGARKNSRFVPGMQLLSMRRTVLSHLIFNYMNSPGVLLYLPIVILSLMALIGISSLAVAFAVNVAGPEYGVAPEEVYLALRKTLIDGRLTLLLTLFSFITMLIFVAFYFISTQAKYHFQESYVTLARMNRRLRRLEEHSGQKSGPQD